MAADLWSNPDHFPLRIEPWERRARFVPLSREQYRTLSFIDDRYVSVSDSWEVSLDDLLRTLPAQPAADARPVHCIYHVAFCGSTFVARCLDGLRGTLVLKEPFPVHELASLKRHDPRMQERAGDWEASFDLLMRLLSRTYADAQVAIVKPTDASTHLIGDVLAHSASSAALFLYVGLEAFLHSVLGDDTRRGFVRERLADLSVLFPGHPVFDPKGRPSLTDAECAACLWLLHREIYLGFARDHPHARCRSLNFDTFLNRPSAALAAIADLFGISVDAGDITAALRSEGALHSKERQTPYTPADRATTLRAVGKTHREEVRVARAWADRAAGAYPFPEALPLPLEIV